MRAGGSLEGVLERWNDERGFGWVEARGEKYFVHIREFAPGQPRPRDGERLSFRAGTDDQGRPRALELRLRRQTGAIGLANLGLLGCLLLVPLGAGLTLPVPGWVVPAGMTTASLVTLVLYRVDKARADARRWRIPEATLHLWELAGGWPGAFLAQRRYRHKTRKLRFQVTYWAIVGLHQVIAIEVASGFAASRWMRKILESRLATGG